MEEYRIGDSVALYNPTDHSICIEVILTSDKSLITAKRYKSERCRVLLVEINYKSSYLYNTRANTQRRKAINVRED